MKKFTNTIMALLVVIGVLTSCDQNLTEELIAIEDSTEISSDEIKSAVETLSFKYSITAVNDDDRKTTISSDEELTAYSEKNTRGKFVFPIEITVDGKTITVNDKSEMKALIGKKRRNHRKPNFTLVFPVTVATADGDVIVEDREAFKACRESLEEGTHPAFVYPISVVYKEETIIINSEEALKALKPERGEKPTRPELVFPVSVVTADGDLEITNKDAMKAYKETLEEGIRPEFVFPMSVIVHEKTVVVNNEEELKALMPKKRNRLELVFPVSVVTTVGDLEIADQNAMKAYKETLEEGTHFEFVFPIYVIVHEKTVLVNNEAELKALKPKKHR
jgi:hypothetical protein